MRKILGFLFAMILISTTSVFAADTSLVEVNNKFCPISREEVGSGGMIPGKVTHNGKVYNLCCSMCERDFMKDPDKYAKMLDEQAASEK